MKTRLMVRKSITLLRLLLGKIGDVIYKSEYEMNRDKWYSDGCEESKKIDFPGLNSNSIVLDAGGWRGDWASDIYSRYKPTIHVFEPVQEYAQFISKRFEMNSQIIVHSYGLGAMDQKMPIYIGREGSSIFMNKNTSSLVSEIEICDVYKYFEEKHLDRIDLFKINIEGGEYDLLDRVFEKKLHTSINRFLIQFHDFVEDAVVRRNEVRAKLAETHDLLFDYPFVWEYWMQKPNNI